MQVFNDKKERTGVIKDYKDRMITKTLDTGDKELSFKYPTDGTIVEILKEEHYIRTKDDEFVIKAIDRGDLFNKYTAALNVEELEGAVFPFGFASEEHTIKECLEFAFEGTGWTIGICEITKERTIDIEEATTAWDVLQSALSTYRAECNIDSINKVIDIYEKVGRDRGCYFVEGLNLRKLTANSDTYEFYTRIVPIGKDGITIKWLNGQNYIENTQYSTKEKTYVWRDERYTNTTSLIEDATAKLEEISKPYKVYAADVVDLAKANENYKDVLDFDIGDTVTMISKRMKLKEKQRIVKITEYPETPEKNSVELSNTTKTFAEVQKSETELAKQEAISIANNTTKTILYRDYWTKKEVESHITASEQKISLGVSSTYETKEKVAEKYELAVKAGQDAADAAEANANSYLVERLREYSTTEEMRSAIDMSASSINMSVSSTYETKEKVAEKYELAVKAGQDAADAAEANANDATDEKLKQYSTTVEMQSAINMTTSNILMEVKKVENGNLHNYIENGDFESEFDGWETSTDDNVALDHETLGKAVFITRKTSAESYVYQTIPVLPVGTYRIRYKAATVSGCESIARVQCKVGGTSKLTSAGQLKKEEFTQFEFEITTTSKRTNEKLYIYCTRQNAPIYITDVEVLGGYDGYADAKIELTSNSIMSSVNEKVNGSEFGTLITQNAYNVQIAWNNVSEYIKFENDGITLYNDDATSNKKRTVFNYTGEHFYLEGYYIGKIGTNKFTGTSNRGLVFDLENQAAYMTWAYKDNATESDYEMKWSYCAKACGNYAGKSLHAGADIDMHNYKLKNVSWEKAGVSQTINFVQILEMNADGTASRWGPNGTMTFTNGILTNLNYYDK